MAAPGIEESELAFSVSEENEVFSQNPHGRRQIGVLRKLGSDSNWLPVAPEELAGESARPDRRQYLKHRISVRRRSYEEEEKMATVRTRAEVDIYEVNGETNIAVRPKMVITTHWGYDRKVVVEGLDGVKLTVLASDLRLAIDRCSR